METWGRGHTESGQEMGHSTWPSNCQVTGEHEPARSTAPRLGLTNEPHPTQGLCDYYPQVRQGQVIRLVRKGVPRSSWTQDKQEGGSPRRFCHSRKSQSSGLAVRGFKCSHTTGGTGGRGASYCETWEKGDPRPAGSQEVRSTEKGGAQWQEKVSLSHDTWQGL